MSNYRPVHLVVCVSLALILLSGCSYRKSGSYRLTSKVNHPVFIPPRSSENTTEKLVTFRSAAINRLCDLTEQGIRVKAVQGKVRVTAKRDQFAAMSHGGLLQWSTRLQEQGCIAPGEAYALASMLSSLFPMPLGMSDRLIHSNLGTSGYVDLQPGYRLRIISPIRESGNEAAPIIEESGELKQTPDGKFSIDLRASSDLIGVEEAWYTIEKRKSRAGNELLPVHAVTRIDDRTDKTSKSRFRYFKFDSEVVIFRLFFLAWDGGENRKTMLLGGKNETALDLETQRLNRDPDACTAMQNQVQCFMVPEGVAFIPFIAIRVNGDQVTVSPGTTLRNLFRQDLRQSIEEIMPTLVIEKLYREKLTPVIFSKNDQDILSLPLTGGESVRW